MNSRKFSVIILSRAYPAPTLVASSSSDPTKPSCKKAGVAKKSTSWHAVAWLKARTHQKSRRRSKRVRARCSPSWPGMKDRYAACRTYSAALMNRPFQICTPWISDYQVSWPSTGQSSAIRSYGTHLPSKPSTNTYAQIPSSYYRRSSQYSRVLNDHRWRTWSNETQIW